MVPGKLVTKGVKAPTSVYARYLLDFIDPPESKYASLHMFDAKYIEVWRMMRDSTHTINSSFWHSQRLVILNYGWDHVRWVFGDLSSN